MYTVYTVLTSVLADCEKWFIVSFAINAAPDGQLVCLEEPPFPTGQGATTAASNKPGYGTEEEVDLGLWPKGRRDWMGGRERKGGIRVGR